jgi:cytochrome P450
VLAHCIGDELRGVGGNLRMWRGREPWPVRFGFPYCHPHERQRVLAELSSVLGGRAPTMADLPLLRYTRAALDETLRLYPPAWTIGRQPRQDAVVAGIAMPRGIRSSCAPG